MLLGGIFQDHPTQFENGSAVGDTERFLGILLNKQDGDALILRTAPIISKILATAIGINPTEGSSSMSSLGRD